MVLSWALPARRRVNPALNRRFLHHAGFARGRIRMVQPFTAPSLSRGFGMTAPLLFAGSQTTATTTIATATTRHARGGDVVDFRRVAAFGGLEAVRATYVRHSFSPHFHDTFAIGVITRGSCAMACRGETYLLREGHLLLIAPGEVHTGQQVGEDGWSYCMIYPAAETVVAATRRAGRALGADNRLVFRSPVVSDPQLAAAAHAMYETIFEDPGDAGVSCAERQEKVTFDFLALVMASQIENTDRHWLTRPHSPRPHPAMRAVRDYLHAHSADPVTLRALADVAGLSSFYTVRLFQATFGISPLAYLAVLRVHRAQALIRDGASIAQAALDSGFHDQSHLTRFFKRVSGMTPGVYAKATRPR
jgi:AraC-like DNA-binding protein